MKDVQDTENCDMWQYWEKSKKIQVGGRYTLFLETQYWKDVTSLQMDLSNAVSQWDHACNLKISSSHIKKNR